MRVRIKERAKTSGRADDNEESLMKRFITFRDTSFPVIQYYEDKGKVDIIDSSPPVDEVYTQVKASIKKRLPNF